MTDTPTCLDIARKAAKGRLTDQEILDAFEREQKIRQSFIDAGKTDNLDQRVANAIVRQATDAKISAALKRKAAALNILAREKLDARIESLKAQGLTPRNAILATIEGTQRFAKEGRVSAARQMLANEQRYVGEILAQAQRDKPHIIDLMHSKSFDEAVTRELYELRKGGTPGKTGNSDAQYLAKTLATGMEMSRTDLNRLGAEIGRLDGYAGPQVHDDLALLKAGRDKWVNDIAPMLDQERTFSDVASETEARQILGDVYDTIITGVSNKPSAALLGQRVGPANLAKRQGQHRVLHFTDADAAIRYRDTYGRGSTIGLILAHQRNAAKTAAAMELFGPNPDVMVKAIVARETIKLKDKLSGEPNQQSRLGRAATPKGDAKILKQMNTLTPEKFQPAIDQMTGMSSVPVSVGSAQLHSNIRAGIGMAKLGAALISSFNDVATAASASMYRGQGFWNGLFQTLGGMFENMGGGKAKEFSYLLGEGFDGLTGHIASPAVAEDGPPGAIARAAETFFHWSGLSGWTDSIRAASARLIAAHLGMNAAKGFDKLDVRHQNVLALNGIDAAKWEAIRQTAYKADNGETYISPDHIRLLTDEQIRPLAAKDDPKAIAEARRSLEMDLRGYIADETNYAVVETDPASRRLTTAGYRPGTLAGEALRYIYQFKGYPTAFAQRIVGRAFLGAPGANMAERIMNNAPHIGALMAGMTVTGYMSMVMKDAVKGIWPPRDPYSAATWGAAFVQGGGLGIYGDFLFGQTSRYGQSGLVTALGPGVGIASDIYDLYNKARTGDAKAADALNLIVQNTPYINLFYVKPVVDTLFLNALRDTVSPGYLARQRQRRQQDYGQTYILPRTLSDLVH